MDRIFTAIRILNSIALLLSVLGYLFAPIFTVFQFFIGIILGLMLVGEVLYWVVRRED